MTIDVDVIVERDATDAPLREDKALFRQRRQRRLVQFLEQLTAADTELAHRPGVEISDQRRDRRIELGQREEALVAQPRQYPALYHQHADLDLSLVAWPANPRR